MSNYNPADLDAMDAQDMAAEAKPRAVKPAQPAYSKAQILASLVKDVWPKVATGEVKPTIYKVLPITEAEAAHDILYRGENVGKVVLTVE